MRARKEWLEWFRVDRDLPEHPKLYELAAAGGWSRDKALGRLVRLWAWVAKQAASGRMTGRQVAGLSMHMFDLEQASNHAGQVAAGFPERCPCCREADVSPEAVSFAGQTLAPFFQAGFIHRDGEEFVVHDWAEMNGYALRERERNRERKSLNGTNPAAVPKIPAVVPRQNRGNGYGTDTEVKKKHTRPETEPDGFEEFYSLYPRREARRAAAKAFASALGRHRGRYEADHLVAAAEEFAGLCQGKDPKFIPLPATWLNQDRFRDLFDETVPDDEEAHETPIEDSTVPDPF